MDYLGIDISKRKFDVCLEIKGKKQRGTFENNHAGFKKLLGFLSKNSVQELSCCLESTGKYGNNLAGFLYKQGYKVSIINPKCIKAFAESQLIRNKSDKIDAELIAQYCEVFSEQLISWQPKSEIAEKINETNRRIEDLERMKRAEENRLTSGIADKVVLKSVKKMIRLLIQEIKDLEEELNQTIDGDDDLKRQKELLVSIPGVADKSANMIIAEVGEIEKFEKAQKLVAYAGVSPKKRQSGSSLNTKGQISRQGNTRIRTSLYFPAISAIQHNPIIRKFALRLKERGITGKKLVCAVIRKLIHQIFGVLKNQKPFDPNFLNLIQSTS